MLLPPLASLNVLYGRAKQAAFWQEDKAPTFTEQKPPAEKHLLLANDGVIVFVSIFYNMAGKAAVTDSIGQQQ